MNGEKYFEGISISIIGLTILAIIYGTTPFIISGIILFLIFNRQSDFEKIKKELELIRKEMIKC